MSRVCGNHAGGLLQRLYAHEPTAHNPDGEFYSHLVELLLVASESMKSLSDGQIEEAKKEWALILGIIFMEVSRGGGKGGAEGSPTEGLKSDALSNLPFLKALKSTFAKRGVLTDDVYVISSGLVGRSQVGVREGDVLCLVWGCARPLVLRPLDVVGEEDKGKERFELVGEAWVPGIMRGEMMGEDWSSQLREFELC